MAPGVLAYGIHHQMSDGDERIDILPSMRGTHFVVSKRQLSEALAAIVSHNCFRFGNTGNLSVFANAHSAIRANVTTIIMPYISPPGWRTTSSLSLSDILHNCPKLKKVTLRVDFNYGATPSSLKFDLDMNLLHDHQAKVDALSAALVSHEAFEDTSRLRGLAVLDVELWCTSWTAEDSEIGTAAAREVQRELRKVAYMPREMQGGTIVSSVWDGAG
jgi:hypothetical protein